MANDDFVINTRVETISNGKLVDFANFGTDPTKPDYGGANEHWLSYSDLQINISRRADPTADVLGHIVQTWASGTIVEWDRYSDVFNYANHRIDEPRS